MKWECRLTGEVSDIVILHKPETAVQYTKHSWMHPLLNGKGTADVFLALSQDCHTDINNRACYSCTDVVHILSFQGQSKDSSCLWSCCRGSGVTQRAVPIQVCGGLKQHRKRVIHERLCCKEQVFFIPLPLKLHIYPPVSLSLLLHSPANQVTLPVSSPSPPHLLFCSHVITSPSSLNHFIYLDQSRCFGRIFII